MVDAEEPRSGPRGQPDVPDPQVVPDAVVAIAPAVAPERPPVPEQH